MYNLNFEEMQRRLVTNLRESVRNGYITERSLARMTGVSQPHMHHVLRGKRGLSIEKSDQVMRALRNDLLDLLEPEDIEEWKNRD
jgi:transcriptional regulator with XRE-family HTH domain